MSCNKCGNELKEDDVFCNKCGASVTETTENEGVKKKKTKIIIVVSVVICVIAVLGICVYGYFYTKNKESNNINKDETVKTNSANLENTTVKSEKEQTVVSDLSFSNMKSDDDSFNEVQKEILEYFDNNYFFYDGYQAQKYPEVFKGAKVQSDVVVIKILKSTAEEYEVLAVQGGGIAHDFSTNKSVVYDYELSSTDIEDLKQENLMLLKGKQLDERLLKGDVITIYGRYNDIETKDIDGKSYTLPSIDLINVIQLGRAGDDAKDKNRFSLSTIKTVAEYIFGKDIKINEPTVGNDYKNEQERTFNPYYKVTLDNQSNANFKAFNMYKKEGVITYNTKLNGISDNIVKRIFVSADFQHYIISTYDEDLKYVYIDYFDNNFTKLWGREFKINSNSEEVSGPIDYTSDVMSLVIDNDLYIIDLKTGNNIVEPVIVGTKNCIRMFDDGILLIGTDTKDTIMKVDYTGKTIYKQNISSNMVLITASTMQKVNENIVICLYGEDNNELTGSAKKYLVIDNDGNIKISTNEITSGL